jgi:hypothetical protein
MSVPALGRHHHHNAQQHQEPAPSTTNVVTPPPVPKSHHRLRRSHKSSSKLPDSPQSGPESLPKALSSKRAQHRHTASLHGNSRPPAHTRQSSAGPHAASLYADLVNDSDAMSDLGRKITKLREHAPSIHGSSGHKKDGAAGVVEPIKESTEAVKLQHWAEEAVKESQKAESRNK